jgi:hypothetical protein
VPGEVYGRADQVFAPLTKQKTKIHVSIVPTCEFFSREVYRFGESSR